MSGPWARHHSPSSPFGRLLTFPLPATDQLDESECVSPRSSSSAAKASLNSSDAFGVAIARDLPLMFHYQGRIPVAVEVTHERIRAGVRFNRKRKSATLDSNAALRTEHFDRRVYLLTKPHGKRTLAPVKHPPND